MEKQNSFRKTVGWLAILSALFAFGNFALTGMASGGNPESLSDMNSFVHVGETAGNIMKWSWLSDMLGYYLLTVPVIFLLYFWLKDKNPYWMGIFTFCGLAYVLSGSLGAAMLAKTWPTLISGYANSEGISKEIYDIVFTNSTETVYGGMWAYLEFLLAGVWWMGVGFAMRSERKLLGTITIILGVFAIIATLGEILEIEIIALAGLMVYLLLAPVWAAWLGVSLIKGKDIHLSKL